MTLVASKPKHGRAAGHGRPLSLREGVTRLGKPERVDREKGVIYGVKILGLESANGRRYTPAAVAAAAPLYEGLAVNTDHPAKANETRSVHDRFGWFENVQVRQDGLYGDFHLVNPKTELAESLLNAAEQKPDLYGFSHNALGEGESVGGIFEVRTITDVRSVDLVAEPATTNGLFEGRKPMAKKAIKAVLEGLVSKLPSNRRAALTRLIEDDTMAQPMAAEMDDPAADEPAGADWRSALAAVLSQLMSTEDPEAHEVGSKIHSLLKLKPEAPATEAEDDDEEEVAEAEDDEKEVAEADDDEDKAKKEGKVRVKVTDPAVKDLREELAIRDLVEDAGLKFQKPEQRKAFVKSLVPLTAAERKALIEERKQLTESGVQKPRSQSPGKQPRTGGAGYQSFVESLRG